MEITAARIYESVKAIRKMAPVIHNITNYVVMNSTANALLAVGASPVMAHAQEEVEEMVAIAQALVINIGTISESWVASMFRAVHQARRKGIPVVLDPVGAGATAYRTRTARELIENGQPTIIRGNASEIMALADDRSKTKGVDSAAASDAAIVTAREIAQKHKCVVCISGATDYIIDNEKITKIKNGHPLMTKVTGLGCTASALCGAFAAVEEIPFAATAVSMAVMGIAGEIAVEKSDGPGSLQANILDVLYLLTEDDINKRLKIEG